MYRRTSRTPKICPRCHKMVYPMEELRCLDKYWHKSCFRCTACGTQLNLRTFRVYNKYPYCEAHFPKLKPRTELRTSVSTKRSRFISKNPNNIFMEAKQNTQAQFMDGNSRSIFQTTRNLAEQQIAAEAAARYNAGAQYNAHYQQPPPPEQFMQKNFNLPELILPENLPNTQMQWSQYPERPPLQQVNVQSAYTQMVQSIVAAPSPPVPDKLLRTQAVQTRPVRIESHRPQKLKSRGTQTVPLPVDMMPKMHVVAAPEPLHTQNVKTASMQQQHMLMQEASVKAQGGSNIGNVSTNLATVQAVPNVLFPHVQGQEMLHILELKLKIQPNMQYNLQEPLDQDEQQQQKLDTEQIIWQDLTQEDSSQEESQLHEQQYMPRHKTAAPRTAHRVKSGRDHFVKEIVRKEERHRRNHHRNHHDPFQGSAFTSQSNLKRIAPANYQEYCKEIYYDPYDHDQETVAQTNQPYEDRVQKKQQAQENLRENHRKRDDGLQEAHRSRRFSQTRHQQKRHHRSRKQQQETSLEEWEAILRSRSQEEEIAQKKKRASEEREMSHLVKRERDIRQAMREQRKFLKRTSQEEEMPQTLQQEREINEKSQQERVNRNSVRTQEVTAKREILKRTSQELRIELALQQKEEHKDFARQQRDILKKQRGHLKKKSQEHEIVQHVGETPKAVPKQYDLLRRISQEEEMPQTSQQDRKKQPVTKQEQEILQTLREQREIIQRQRETFERVSQEQERAQESLRLQNILQKVSQEHVMGEIRKEILKSASQERKLEKSARQLKEIAHEIQQEREILRKASQEQQREILQQQNSSLTMQHEAETLKRALLERKKTASVIQLKDASLISLEHQELPHSLEQPKEILEPTQQINDILQDKEQFKQISKTLIQVQDIPIKTQEETTQQVEISQMPMQKQEILPACMEKSTQEYGTQVDEAELERERQRQKLLQFAREAKRQQNISQQQQWLSALPQMPHPPKAPQLLRRTVNHTTNPDIFDDERYRNMSSHYPVYRAIYNYTAHAKNEVSFEKNDIIIGVGQEYGGWLTGRVQHTGKIGMFPGNYVERTKNNEIYFETV